MHKFPNVQKYRELKFLTNNFPNAMVSGMERAKEHRADRYVVIVWMHDHWAVTWYGNEEAEADRVGEEASKKVKALVVDTWVGEVTAGGTACDTAIMHGPGHMSVSVCRRRGPHTEHICEDDQYVWEDMDLNPKTYTHNGKEYRMASTGYFDDKHRRF